MKKFFYIALFSLFLLGNFLFVPNANAIVQSSEIMPYQLIDLDSGWNIISTPRVLVNHEFSVSEISDNLDIYLLNPDSVSGWQTMQEADQSEFEPLYAYFINNKTGQNQILRLNYDFDLSPAERLFQRTLSAGWNAVGVASPDYALKKGTTNIDTNNIDDILNSIINSASQVVDFTADQTNLDSVKIGDRWSSKTTSEINSLNDFRELKAYGIFIEETTDDYYGSQNINDGFNFSVSDNNPTEIEVYGDLQEQTFFIFEIDSLYDIDINSLVFSHGGTGDKDDISNFKLYDVENNELLGSVANIDSDNNLIFLNLEIGVNSGTKKIKLVGDVSSVASMGETHEFLLENAVLNYGVTITGLPISNNLTIIKLEAGTLTLAKSSDCPSGNIAKDGVGVTIAKFDIEANGENIRITSMVVDVYGTVAENGLDQGAIFFDGVQKGATTDLNTASLAGDGLTTFSFGNTLVVPTGETKTLEIRANIDKGSGADWTGDGSETLTPSIVSVVATGKSSSQSVSSVSQTGNQLTIKAGTLSASLNNAQPSWTASNPTGVAGVNDRLIGSFIITAGSSEGARVTALKLQDTSALFTDVQNVRVYRGTLTSGTQIGTTRGSVTAGSSYTFYASPYVTLSASEQIVVNVYADIKTGVSAGAQGSVDLNYVYGTGAVTNTSINYVTEVTGQTVYVSGNGTLTVAEDAANPSSAQLIMGTTDVDMLKAKLTASAEENMNVTQVVVTAGLGSDTPTSTVKNIKLYDGTTPVGSVVSSLASDGTATFDLTANPFVVLAGQNKVLTVKADINTYLNATSSGSVALGLASAAVTSKGAVSSVSGGTSGAVSGSDMYTYKTVVTVDEGQTASVIRSNDTELLYFTVTNNGDYDAYLNAATFTVYYLQGNGNATTSATRTFSLYKSTDGYNTAVGTVNLDPDTTIGSSSPVVITPGTAVAIAAGQTVTFKLKGDLSDCGVSTGSTTGSTIKFYINSGSDLDWDDGVSASIASTYTEDFPVNGPLTQF